MYPYSPNTPVLISSFDVDYNVIEVRKGKIISLIRPASPAVPDLYRVEIDGKITFAYDDEIELERQ